MSRTYCTLFDENYLLRGLALHASLRRHDPTSHLHILTMTQRCYQLLAAAKLERVTLWTLEEFMDDELRVIRPTRTPVEFCWTLTPSLPTFLFKKFPDLAEVSYIDADCFYFSDPEPLYQEMGAKDVLIIEHRYSKSRQYMQKTSGRFNVGLVVFRNTPQGRAVLEDWRVRCNEWCYYRYEDGKLGDQLYLDAWPDSFPGVHILQHAGGCVAPWNMDRWWLTESLGGKVQVNWQPLIFYHYHGFRLFRDFRIFPARGYEFTPKALRLIYEPYLLELRRQWDRVRRIDSNFEEGFGPEETVPAPLTLQRRIKEWMKTERTRLKGMVKAGLGRGGISS